MDSLGTRVAREFYREGCTGYDFGTSGYDGARDRLAALIDRLASPAPVPAKVIDLMVELKKSLAEPPVPATARECAEQIVRRIKVEAGIDIDVHDLPTMIQFAFADYAAAREKPLVEALEEIAAEHDGNWCDDCKAWTKSGYASGNEWCVGCKGARDCSGYLDDACHYSEVAAAALRCRQEEPNK